MKKIQLLFVFSVVLIASNTIHLSGQSRFRDATDSFKWIQWLKRIGDLKYLSKEDLDSLRYLRLQKVVPDTGSSSYFPLQVGNEWVYNSEQFSYGYDTIRVDSAITLGGRQYYRLNQSIPVWVSYKGKYETDYWLTTDKTGNVYALVNGEERPLMLFDQEKVSSENYFGWDDVLSRTSLTISHKEIPLGDELRIDGVIVSHFSPAQRGSTWIFCKGVGLVFFETYNHGMYHRRTLTSYKSEVKNED